MPEVERGKLSDAQVNAITARLNGMINVPLMPEWAEGLIFKGAVMAVDYFVLRQLGEPVYDLIFEIGQGVEDEAELNALITRLAILANTKMDVPMLNEEQEGRFFFATISMIVAALYKGRDVNSTSKPSAPVPNPARPEDADDIDETDLRENHGSVGEENSKPLGG